MTANRERFTGKATGYARYREQYDAALILRLLQKWCGLTSEWVVADIGTGTGMLAQVFLSNGNAVLGVEPNQDMRKECASGLDANQGSRLELRDGSAEATGLASGSVDLVAVGRALHWFDVEAAFVEFRRILKPDGWVAIIAEGRSPEGRRENEELEALLRRMSGDGRSTRERYAVYMTPEKRFTEGSFLHAEAVGEMQLSWDALRGYVQSLSYAPVETDPRHARFETSLRALFEEYAVDGVFKLATRCFVNAGQIPPEG